MSQDFMKSTGFHEIRRISCEIRRISKDQQLPGMVRPMFNSFVKRDSQLSWSPENDLEINLLE